MIRVPVTCGLSAYGPLSHLLPDQGICLTQSSSVLRASSNPTLVRAAAPLRVLRRSAGTLHVRYCGTSDSSPLLPCHATSRRGFHHLFIVSLSFYVPSRQRSAGEDNDYLADIARMVGEDPSRPLMQSIVPAGVLSLHDQVTSDTEFPEDHYFVQTEDCRLGWLGDAVGQDFIIKASRDDIARDPTVPAWSMPAFPVISMINATTVRVPLLDQASSSIRYRIVAPPPDLCQPFEPTAIWHRILLTVLQRVRNTITPHKVPCVLVGFLEQQAADARLGQLVSILQNAARAFNRKAGAAAMQWTFLIQGGTYTSIPPVVRKEPPPYTMRSCERDCPRCDISDELLRTHDINDDASLEQIIAYTSALTHPNSGWTPHYPQRDVFRVPEESTPVCSVESIPADLRSTVQDYFDHHASNLPTSISARSPLYNYDADGGVILKFPHDQQPAEIVRTHTLPGVQRRVMYTEIMKDLARSPPGAHLITSCHRTPLRRLPSGIR